MKTSLNSLHHQVNDWLREVEFYKQETSLLKKRLEEVAAQNSGQDVMAQVEHFQNKFIVQSEQIDILHHDLNKQSEAITLQVKEKPEHAHEKFLDVNDKMQQRVKIFTSGFGDLRFEFNKFLSKAL